MEQIENTENSTDKSVRQISALVPITDKPQRDKKGRFLPGNNLTPVNRVRKKIEEKRVQYTKAFLKSVSKEDIDKVAKRLLEDSLNGNVTAARLLLDHILEIQKNIVNIEGNAQILNNGVLQSKSELISTLESRHSELKLEKDNELRFLFEDQLKNNLISIEKYNELVSRHCPNPVVLIGQDDSMPSQ